MAGKYAIIAGQIFAPVAGLRIAGEHRERLLQAEHDPKGDQGTKPFIDFGIDSFDVLLGQGVRK